MRVLPAGLARRFTTNRSGAAAVEFAVIVPMLLTLYIGASDLSIAVTLNRKLQATSATVADLIAQGDSTTKSQLSLTLGVAKALVQPYDSTKLKAVLSSVTVDAKGKAKVDWSSAANGATALVKGSTYVLPASLSAQLSRSFVVVETGYTYAPLGGFGLKIPIQMRETAYVTPRNTTAAVACPDC